LICSDTFEELRIVGNALADEMAEVVPITKIFECLGGIFDC
jgi:hypothetical protein